MSHSDDAILNVANDLQARAEKENDPEVKASLLKSADNFRKTVEMHREVLASVKASEKRQRRLMGAITHKDPGFWLFILFAIAYFLLRVYLSK